MTVTRTDIHCPSQIIPTDYEFVCFEYIKIEDIGDCYFLNQQRDKLKKHMALTGGNYSSHTHGGNCMVCGNAQAIYTVLFYHRDTNTYIRMGQDCAAKVDMSCGDWNAFRAAVHNALDAKAGKAKAQAFLDMNGISDAWALYNDTNRLFKYEENTICDIVGKLVKYGSISEAQKNFVVGLLDKIKNRDIIEAQRKAERDAAAPCPSGRILVKGTVLSVKTIDGFYGAQEKILVQADAGYKVYGSNVKIGGRYAVKGDKIEFKATITPSEDDNKFGFFKRPAGQ